MALPDLSHDAAAGDHIRGDGKFESQIEDRTKGMRLFGFDEGTADTQFAEEFIRARKDTVLADPQFSPKADPRMPAMVFKCCGTTVHGDNNKLRL